MYNIAICDNDGVDLDIAERAVQKYLALHPLVDGKVKTFHFSSDLKRELAAKSSYDLYLLDIMMPETDGISLGRLIREKTSTTPIIYITVTKDMAYEAFGVNALRYISKPLEEANLFAALDFAYDLYQHRPRHILMLNSKNGIVWVAQEDIMFIENNLRTAIYHTTDGSVISCSRSSGSFENSVGAVKENEKFIQPHKSYFVNMKYIKHFQNVTITMDDDTAIPVNQHNLTRVRSRYMQYLSDFAGW